MRSFMRARSPEANDGETQRVSGRERASFSKAEKPPPEGKGSRRTELKQSKGPPRPRIEILGEVRSHSGCSAWTQKGLPGSAGVWPL